jgi:LmbE family N-acetylglucosaminyl deacetylase
MSGQRDPLEPIDYEIIEEKAATLARVAERLEAKLAALEAVEREMGPQPSAEALARRATLREEAAEWLWYLVVQREAVGVTHHDAVFETYRVPGEIRRLMGPRRKARASG